MPAFTENDPFRLRNVEGQHEALVDGLEEVWSAHSIQIKGNAALYLQFLGVLASVHLADEVAEVVQAMEAVVRIVGPDEPAVQ